MGLVITVMVFVRCQGEDASGPAAMDSNALIVLTSPQGGETFYTGETIQIKWSTPKVDLNYPVDAIDIRFSWDGGQRWVTLNPDASITPNDSDWGNYAWTVPNTLAYADLNIALAGRVDCLLRVEQYGTGNSMQRFTVKSGFSIRAEGASR